MVVRLVTGMLIAILVVSAALAPLDGCHGLVSLLPVAVSTRRRGTTSFSTAVLFSRNEDNNNNNNDNDDMATVHQLERRRVLLQRGLSVGLVAASAFVIPPTTFLTTTTANSVAVAVAAAVDNNVEQTKFVQQYEDFTRTPEGWSYRDVVTPGKGEKAQLGDRVVFEWSGYTIGYFGRPFQAKGGPQGVRQFVCCLLCVERLF
jgi:hypothetical protein